ncbi:hypothetical protein CTAYLR_004101 [Chrysophaeum taylorii]|uniref:serine C-palmitoyltransferase n=1 Tax=Chrysophaeum taylorii TaxID=2483200 RepID=A0AAD7XLD3_9STRA|nr:hypothetical protein CTAYLR_004101 [Chrysophaeum taylorii]
MRWWWPAKQQQIITAPPPAPPPASWVREVLGQVSWLPRAYAEWWRRLLRESPEHVAVETLLIIFVVFLLFGWRKKKEAAPLSEQEIEELCAEWEPEPLVPLLKKKTTAVVTAYGPGAVAIDGRTLLNFGALDCLGMSLEPRLKEAATAALRKYGCGSCGPRGFYGSIDLHVELEKKVAAFFGAEKAIAFSDASSCATSTVAAFAKRGDLLLVDFGVSEPLQTGCVLSRAQVVVFRDADELERTMISIERDDFAKKRTPGSQRRFVVCEAISRDFGTVAPLSRIVDLKNKFGYRLILDESLTFATTGATGRGIKEELGLPSDAVEITTIDLGPALGSVGGICVGTKEVIDHQRLSGAGYCFSAAAPPFVSAAAMAALDIVPERLPRLRENVKFLHDQLSSVAGLSKLSAYPSPVIFLANPNKPLRTIVDVLKTKGFALALAHDNNLKSLLPPRSPAIRVAISARHSKPQLTSLSDFLLKIQP